MRKYSKQNQKVDLYSVKTENLKKKQILSICKLKNSFWRWTIKKQLEWYKKTVKKKDINNMLIINNNLAGYCLLRKRKAYQNNKSFIYYYLDSFVINKKYRNNGSGRDFLLFNNKILKKVKKHSMLTCRKGVHNFYKKCGWKIIPKNKFQIMDHKSFWLKNKADLRVMIYNSNRKTTKKIFYYINQYYEF